MKTYFAAAMLAMASSALESSDFEFINYLTKHGKMYKTLDEFMERKVLFLARDQLIKQHQSRPANFTLGHNKFSDWKPEEM